MLFQRWLILDSGGNQPISFTSFFDIEYRNEGKALTYPVEKGAFANYNKVQNPGSIKVTLGVQGNESDFDSVLQTLDTFQQEAEVLSISTPATYYLNYTLESYSYRRTLEAGAGMLVVELTLVEVREVETQTTTTVITEPKNPTSSGKKNTGKTQTNEPEEKNESLAHIGFGNVF